MKRSLEHCARRERLLSAAQMIFVERGFHRATVAEMSARSGVPVGQIYRYFANKDAIITAIVERDCETVLPQEPPAKDDPAALAGWILRLLVRWDADGLGLRSEIASEAVRNASIRSIVRSAESHARAHVLLAISAALPAASADDLALLVELVFCLSNGAMQRQMLIRYDTRGVVMAGAIDLVAREIARIGDRHG